MPDSCPLCEGSGLKIVERGGIRVAQECACRVQHRSSRLLQRAKIPERYEKCSFDNFKMDHHWNDASQYEALVRARDFVKNYPVGTDNQGLLFIGPVGVGKTHLAVSLLRALVTERGVRGLFVDYRDLLKQVQNSYNANVHITELEVLKPVFETEVVVLDELGASKPTEWVFDTVAHILNTRYNDRLTTIVTTNFSNESETAVEVIERMSVAQRAMHADTLGDRVGNRILSRLQEMCVLVEMHGDDYRKTVKRAVFR